MKKKLKFILPIVVILAIIIAIVVVKNKGNENSKEVLSNNIQIIVYDKTNATIYDEKKETNEKYLLDALNSLEDLKVETEDSDYGVYIISIGDLEQGDNYYWNYYVNGEYASVGVSSYEIKNNDVFTFKLEKFE